MQHYLLCSGCSLEYREGMIGTANPRIPPDERFADIEDSSIYAANSIDPIELCDFGEKKLVR